MAYLYAVPNNVPGLTASEGLEHLLSGFGGPDFTMMTERGLEAVPEAFRMRSTLTITSMGKGSLHFIYLGKSRDSSRQRQPLSAF